MYSVPTASGSQWDFQGSSQEAFCCSYCPWLLCRFPFISTQPCANMHAARTSLVAKERSPAQMDGSIQNMVMMLPCFMQLNQLAEDRICFTHHRMKSSNSETKTWPTCPLSYFFISDGLFLLLFPPLSVSVFLSINQLYFKTASPFPPNKDRGWLVQAMPQ